MTPTPLAVIQSDWLRLEEGEEPRDEEGIVVVAGLV